MEFVIVQAGVYKYVYFFSKSNAVVGRSRDRDGDRNRRDKLASQPKRDSSPPPVKRVRRDM